jgi:hypothetical protein
MKIEPFANAAVLDRVQWRRAAVAFGLWLLGGFLVGLAVASLNGGHSSILFVSFGLAPSLCFFCSPLTRPFRTNAHTHRHLSRQSESCSSTAHFQRFWLQQQFPAW